MNQNDIRKTCPKSEYLEIGDEIITLAKEVLSPAEIQEADEISIELTSKSTRREAIKKLQTMTGVRPKRPLYYCHHELKFLPHWTRNPVFYMGAFIEQLVKCMASEMLTHSKWENKPLGQTLGMLRNKLSEPLYSELKKLNKMMNNPAKHVFGGYDRKHLFTSKEVVYIYFISLKLKEKIIEISKEAGNYCGGL